MENIAEAGKTLPLLPECLLKGVRGVTGELISSVPALEQKSRQREYLPSPFQFPIIVSYMSPKVKTASGPLHRWALGLQAEEVILS